MASTHNIILRSILTYIIGSILSIFFLLFVLPMTFLPESMRYKSKVFFGLTSLWSRVWLWVAGISLTMRDQHGLPDQPSVIVMNHGSALDIVLAERLLGSQPRIWLSKREYRSVPILSWILTRMHVMVDVASPMQGAQALKVLKKKASLGNAHVLLFPEGGRFNDGDIHPFFKGFSLLADVLSRPVVPVYIGAAHKAYPKDSVLIQSTIPLSVEVGPAFVRAPQETHEHFVERVRGWFVSKTKES